MEIKSTGHFFSDVKEEVYFAVNGKLPRVGDFETRFYAQRYTDYQGNWSDWRVVGPDTPGVGPATAVKLREKVEPEIKAWLTGPEYLTSRQAEIARCIAREATNGIYGTKNAAELLGKYNDELSAGNRHVLRAALGHLEEGRRLLNEVNQ